MISAIIAWGIKFGGINYTPTRGFGSLTAGQPAIDFPRAFLTPVVRSATFKTAI